MNDMVITCTACGAQNRVGDLGPDECSVCSKCTAPLDAEVHFERLMKACGQGDPQTVRQMLQRHRSLIEEADDRCENATLSPLQAAVQSGHVEVVRALLASGANVDFTNDFGSALHFAVSNRDLETASLLVDSRACLDTRDDDGLTPLHVAAHDGAIALVQFLIDKGASPTASTFHGWTPLHFAAAGGKSECIEMLLRSNVSVNANDNEGGDTPLHLAAFFAELNAITSLLTRGADINKKNKRCLTPLDNAVRGYRNDAEQCGAKRTAQYVASIKHLQDRGGKASLDIPDMMPNQAPEGTARKLADPQR